MADEDDYGALDDGGYDWLYVEDDFPLTDELAETQIPSPGYPGTEYEIYRDHDDLEWLDYWDDLEYIDDEYWDNASPRTFIEESTADTTSRAKRKREESEILSPDAKRRRVLMGGIANVKYVPLAKRLESFFRLPPMLESGKGFALLPDWKERFANETGDTVQNAMPEAMKKAAEAQDEDSPDKRRQFDALAEDGDEEEWMDEDEEGEGEDMVAQLASWDPEMLKSILKQRLGDAGLGDMDEASFMAAIAKMMAGDEGGEDATGDLANALLGRATQGKDSALSGWLSQQGVSLDDAEEDDDASSVATAELPTAAGKDVRSNVQVSPPDSAIEVTRQNGETRQMALHGSSPSSSSKKRAAPADEGDDASKKRKRVTFDVPSSSQSTQAAVVENGDAKSSVADEATETETGAEVEVETQAEAEIEGEVEAETATSEDPFMSAPPIQNTTPTTDLETTKAKPVTGKVAKKKSSASNHSEGARNYAKPTAAASAKQTRKRKADADEDDVEVANPKLKRQARTAGKAEAELPAVEPAGRRTRSARAKSAK